MHIIKLWCRGGLTRKPGELNFAICSRCSKSIVFTCIGLIFFIISHVTTSGRSDWLRSKKEIFTETLVSLYGNCTFASFSSITLTCRRAFIAFRFFPVSGKICVLALFHEFCAELVYCGAVILIGPRVFRTLYWERYGFSFERTTLSRRRHETSPLETLLLLSSFFAHCWFKVRG